MLFICPLANIEYCLEEKLEALVTAFDHNVCNAYSSRINIAVPCIQSSKVSDTILDKPRNAPWVADWGYSKKLFYNKEVLE